MKKKKIAVNDHFQEYTYYLTEPTGRNFHPDFKPELTPKEMLQLGVFGGHYYTDGDHEFPKSWFTRAKLSDHKAPEKNFFKVNASLSLEEWKKRGWIHPDDPRGWFQWYCRYYYGRRHYDDERQIGRWRKMTRHIGQIKKNCKKGDLDCRRKQRQAVLHWAYDSRKM